jgi:hypothetical protein
MNLPDFRSSTKKDLNLVEKFSKIALNNVHI